jgi:arsenate reductase (thioredoxin)
MVPSVAITRILFLCTGNSARSIIGEFLLRHLAGDALEVMSAGISPRPVPHPLALRVLVKEYGIDITGARSKAVEELPEQPIDIVITVCDQARESRLSACQNMRGGIWSWQHQALHVQWSLPDPVAAVGTESERYQHFLSTAYILDHHLNLLARKPFTIEDIKDRVQLIKFISIPAEFNC